MTLDPPWLPKPPSKVLGSIFTDADMWILGTLLKLLSARLGSLGICWTSFLYRGEDVISHATLTISCNVLNNMAELENCK